MSGYELAFYALTSGAVWHGDTMSKKWSQILYVPPDKKAEVEGILEDADDQSYNWDSIGQLCIARQ